MSNFKQQKYFSYYLLKLKVVSNYWHVVLPGTRNTEHGTRNTGTSRNIPEHPKTRNTPKIPEHSQENPEHPKKARNNKKTRNTPKKTRNTSENGNDVKQFNNSAKICTLCWDSFFLS